MDLCLELIVIKNLKILELGCNVGINLEILKKMGFNNLYGLEINNKAIEIARVIDKMPIRQQEIARKKQEKRD